MESGGSDADAFAGEDGLVLAIRLVAVTAAFDGETAAKMGHPMYGLGFMYVPPVQLLLTLPTPPPLPRPQAIHAHRAVHAAGLRAALHPRLLLGHLFRFLLAVLRAQIRPVLFQRAENVRKSRPLHDLDAFAHLRVRPVLEPVLPLRKSQRHVGLAHRRRVGWERAARQ